jgi:hypothetical protein
VDEGGGLRNCGLEADYVDLRGRGRKHLQARTREEARSAKPTKRIVSGDRSCMPHSLYSGGIALHLAATLKHKKMMSAFKTSNAFPKPPFGAKRVAKAYISAKSIDGGWFSESARCQGVLVFLVQRP